MAITALTPGAVKANTGSGNIASIGLPAAAVAGTFLLLPSGSADNVAGTLATWTGLAGATGNGNTINRMQTFWKIMAAGETTPTITRSVGNSALARMLGFNGVDPSNPILQVGTLNTGTFTGGSGTATALGITPASGQSAIVMVVCTGEASTGGGANNYASWSGANPTLAELTDNLTGLGTAEASLGTAWGLSNTGAATGNRTVALAALDASAGSSWLAVLIELNPATSVFAVDFDFGDYGPHDLGPDPFSDDRAPVSGVTSQVFDQALAATVTAAASIQKQANKILSAPITASASIVKSVAKNVVANVTASAAMQRLVNKTLAAAVTASAVLSGIKVAFLTMVANVAVSASITKTVAKKMVANVTSSAAITKVVNKALSASVVVTATILKLVNKLLAANLSTTATISAIKAVVVNLVASVTASAKIQKVVNKRLSAPVTVTAFVFKVIPAKLVATVITTANLIATYVPAGVGAAVRRLRTMMGMGQ